MGNTLLPLQESWPPFERGDLRRVLWRPIDQPLLCGLSVIVLVESAGGLGATVRWDCSTSILRAEFHSFTSFSCFCFNFSIFSVVLGARRHSSPPKEVDCSIQSKSLLGISFTLPEHILIITQLLPRSGVIIWLFSPMFTCAVSPGAPPPGCPFILARSQA